MSPIRINKRLIPLFVLFALAVLGGIGVVWAQYFEKPQTTELSRESDESMGEVEVQNSREESSTFAVYIAGAVVNPGVYYVLADCRIDDVLRAAGGSTAEAHLASVNLAAQINDAMHIYIPTISEVKESSFDPLELVSSYKTLAQKEQEAEKDASYALSQGGDSPNAKLNTGQGSGSLAGGKVNVNKASASELEMLPGVGPATATKIIDERKANGPYLTVEDLLRVSGIGEKKLEQMRAYLTF